MAKPGFTLDQRAMRELRGAFALGMLQVAHAVEHDAKADAVVRGGHRSRQPDGPVGGTLRRSFHSVAFLDGARVPGSATHDENGEPVPDYAPDGDVVAYVGTNLYYAPYVELGTARMPARPSLGPALAGVAGTAEGIVARSMARVLKG